MNNRGIKFSKKEPSPSRAIPHHLLLRIVPPAQNYSGELRSPAVIKNMAWILWVLIPPPQRLEGVWESRGMWHRSLPRPLGAVGFVPSPIPAYGRSAHRNVGLPPKPAWGFHLQTPSLLRGAFKQLNIPMRMKKRLPYGRRFACIAVSAYSAVYGSSAMARARLIASDS